ncbi:MAG TPA: CHAT domain-containing protein [Chitinophagaceae bacterium]|nr:CHAT domain-containing protein [Chitinophagaceae bacterium]
MNEIVIEILRDGQTVNQLLKSGTNYIALYGSDPAKDFMINCEQQEFNNYVKLLRYDNTNEISRQSGIAFFQDLISGIIDKIYPAQIAQGIQNDMVHLRLVTTPKEIAQLPFEMALTPSVLQNEMPRTPFFVNPKIKTTFTRELRQLSFKQYNWPFKPRILFAWAQPNNKVPQQEHLKAFVDVLRRWALPIKTSVEPVPDVGALITLLPDATLQSIKDKITAAFNDRKPYTHVHLLAHGSNGVAENGEQFLLVLNSDNPAEKSYRAEGSELARSLIIEKDGQQFVPQVVSLIACDSGNVGSPVHPSGSIAHSLHQSGIPCVFASQFPLTQKGSVKLVVSLYTQLLQSSDPRLALYETRAALAADKVHDWASLVAYARFPEDIDEQMKDISLKRMLEFMKTANALTDHVIKYMNVLKKEHAETSFTEVNDRLDSSIEKLTTLLEETQNDKINKDRYAEHYGLIGSAYKRKAEHVFRVAEYKKDVSDDIKNQSKQALKNAKDYYYRGYRFLNSHWNGTQYLSLAVWLNETPTGKDEKEMWTFCKVMAANDEQYAADDVSKAWAYGTLAELYLLQPFIMNLNSPEKENSFAQAKEYLQKLNALQNQQFPKESTARQLERYINWWSKMDDSDTMKQLRLIITELRKELPVLENTI